MSCSRPRAIGPLNKTHNASVSLHGRNSVQASAFIWRTQAATTQTLTVHFSKQTTWSLSRHTQASVYLSAEMLLWDLCGFIWPKIKRIKSSSSVRKENYALFFQQSIVHQESNQHSALKLFAYTRSFMLHLILAYFCISHSMSIILPLSCVGKKAWLEEARLTDEWRLCWPRHEVRKQAPTNTLQNMNKSVFPYFQKWTHAVGNLHFFFSEDVRY